MRDRVPYDDRPRRFNHFEATASGRDRAVSRSISVKDRKKDNKIKKGTSEN